MLRDVQRLAPARERFALDGIELGQAALRVLRHPSVASKMFLITIGDRTVGGLCARDPMVGPWQVPVADCAVTLLDYEGYAGEAYAIGERAPLALIDAPASGRMAVGEAITNLAAARIERLDRVKLSANWMAAAGHPGEDAALYDTVRAVALELCPALGISDPGGQGFAVDAHRLGGGRRRWSAPLSLIVTRVRAGDGRARHSHAALAYRRRRDRAAAGRPRPAPQPARRLDPGAGALAAGRALPDLDEPKLLAGLFAAVQRLAREGLLLAYHDRSDGGLFATVCEMAFAGHCGVTLNLDEICYDEWLGDVDGLERRPELLAGRFNDHVLGALFAEELGAVLQVRAAERERVMDVLRAEGVQQCAYVIGFPNERDELRLTRNAKAIFAYKRAELQRAWSETTWRMQALRDNPECAQQEFDALLDASDPGLSRRRHFRPEGNVASPRGARPRVAILREQGVNGQVEMAAAFDRAGFEAVDVHMSDIIAGRVALAGFKGVAACGGFSYGDVLGGGRGLGQVDPVQRPRAGRIRGLLRTQRQLRAGRVQRLPDDGGAARSSSPAPGTGPSSRATARSSSRRAS